MSNSLNVPLKRSILFWGLTLSCLGLSVLVIIRGAYLYYQLYFGRGVDVLSEAMGAAEYRAFLSDSIGAPTVLLTLGSFILLAFSMLLSIKEKYALAKTLLMIFLLLTAVNHFIAFTKIDIDVTSLSILLGQLFIPIAIVGALFGYMLKYQNIDSPQSLGQ